MKHVIGYLSGKLDYGLVVKKTSGHKLESWSDADWGSDQDKRRSRSGTLLTIGNNPVIWTSKLLPTGALSTAEAEFYALSQCVCEVTWVRQILSEIGVYVQLLTPTFQDNLGAIAWTQEVQGLRKVKHVRLRYHFVKEAVSRRDVEVLYTPSLDNKADTFTKATGGSLFNAQRIALKVLQLSYKGGMSKIENNSRSTLCDLGR